MLYGDNGKIFFIYLCKLFPHLFHCLAIGIFEFKRRYKVENKIDMGCALCHAKIVDSKRLINTFDYITHHLFGVNRFIIIACDRVHVY